MMEKGYPMWTSWAVLVLFLLPVATSAWSADGPGDMRERLANEFAGSYRFNYLFVEDGALYLDESSHPQLLELGKNAGDGVPRITFFNRTAKGEKRAHYSYVFYQEGERITVREFDGAGKFRFDCVGRYQPEKRVLECSAPQAPKPARDTDSPATRKSGLFKRPTSWPAYETINRHNLFRFYDWGFVNIQGNLKVDASGKTVAREAGVITAVRVTHEELPQQGGGN
jgi:hypothetical protein